MLRNMSTGQTKFQNTLFWLNIRFTLTHVGSICTATTEYHGAQQVNTLVRCRSITEMLEILYIKSRLFSRSLRRPHDLRLGPLRHGPFCISWKLALPRSASTHCRFGRDITSRRDVLSFHCESCSSGRVHAEPQLLHEYWAGEACPRRGREPAGLMK